MGDYLDSLARLRCFDLRALYPGHGRISMSPIEDIDRAMKNAQTLLEARPGAKLESFYHAAQAPAAAQKKAGGE